MMRTLFPRRFGPCCCVLLCALVGGCGSEGAKKFGAVGLDGSMTAGGGGGAFDAGAQEHLSGSGGTMGGTGGGALASGGASGTGGLTGSGGAPGSGGNGNGSNTCDQLAADYQKEMPRAKACTVGLGSTQCQHAVPSSLGCGGGCITYVQEPGNLEELKQKWSSNNCDATIRVCPASACITAQPGNCYVSGSLTTPQCQSHPVL